MNLMSSEAEIPSLSCCVNYYSNLIVDLLLYVGPKSLPHPPHGGHIDSFRARPLHCRTSSNFATALPTPKRNIIRRFPTSSLAFLPPSPGAMRLLSLFSYASAFSISPARRSGRTAPRTSAPSTSRAANHPTILSLHSPASALRASPPAPDGPSRPRRVEQPPPSLQDYATFQYMLAPPALARPVCDRISSFVFYDGPHERARTQGDAPGPDQRATLLPVLSVGAAVPRPRPEPVGVGDGSTGRRRHPPSVPVRVLRRPRGGGHAPRRGRSGGTVPARGIYRRFRVGLRHRGGFLRGGPRGGRRPRWRVSPPYHAAASCRVCSVSQIFRSGSISRDKK